MEERRVSSQSKTIREVSSSSIFFLLLLFYLFIFYFEFYIFNGGRSKRINGGRYKRIPKFPQANNGCSEGGGGFLFYYLLYIY